MKISFGMLLCISFLTTLLTSCLIDSPCKDAVQEPLPVLKIAIVNAKNGKSKFVNFANDTIQYNPDSVKIFVQNKFIIDFTKPFKVSNDSTITTDQWVWMDYFDKSDNFLYIQYRKNKIDTLFIEYSAFKKNCNNVAYANFSLIALYHKKTKIDPVKSIYKILH